MRNGIQLPNGKITWRARLQEVFTSAEHLFELGYGTALKGMGFETPQAAYDANPVIEGVEGVDEFRVVVQTPGPWRWWDEASVSLKDRGTGRMVHRSLLGPQRGQFVADTATVTINNELEQVHIVVRSDDEPTMLAAPLLRETLRRVQSNLQLILDAMAPPGIDGTINLVKLAVDVADGVEDPAVLAALFEE